MAFMARKREVDVREVRESFRERVLKGGIVVAPGVFNALTALMVERAGFDAVYVSGASLTASMAMPDLGLITLGEVVNEVKRIVSVITIPAIVDVDTGFGEAINVMRTVRELEEVGASAIQIEDQVLPKKCGHLAGKRLIPPEEMAKKIRAAVKARRDPNFLIIARTDARGVTGFEDAVERALLYLDAGADVIFPEALESKEEFEEFSRRVRAPLLANMTEFGRSPLLTVKELEEMGYRIVIFPVTLLRIAMKAISDALNVVKTEGTQRSLLDKMVTRRELYELISYYAYEGVDKEVSEEVEKIVEKRRR